MNIDELIFVGLNGRVAALNRDTGEIVWSNRQLRSGRVSILLDGDRLVAAINGYLYCLDPLTGELLWQNPLHGYGLGVTHLVSCRGQSDQTFIQHAADEDDQAAAAAS